MNPDDSPTSYKTRHESNPGVAARLPSRESEVRPFKDRVQVLIGSPVAFFAPKDNDDLDRQLADGRFRRVVFAHFDDLLEMIWDEDADFSAWRARGVHIEFLENGALDEDRAGMLLEICASLNRWRNVRRRRRIMAATILSFLAILALAILFYFNPLTH